MKEILRKIALSICFTIAALFVLSIIDAYAAPYPLQEVGGGTGTNVTSSAGQVPISTGSSTYTPATIGCSGGCSITSASGSVTVNAASTAALLANQLITVTLTGPVTGSASGTTAISIPTTITSPMTANVSTTQVTSTNISASTITATATSTLGTTTVTKFTNTNVKSALVLNDSNGNEGAYGGSANPCAANQAPTTISATGALGGCTATLLTGNQTITLTISGDATGTASGATSINDSITVTGLQGKSLPAFATGTLYAKSGSWNIGNAVDSAGNAYLTSTPNPGAATSTFSFVIEYPNVNENDAIYEANATTTLSSCVAVNAGGADTLKWGLNFATSTQRGSATNTMQQAFTSMNTTTSTASLDTPNGSTTIGKLSSVIFWTTSSSTQASSSQFSLTCQITL